MFIIQFWQFWGQQKFLANRVHQSCQKWQMPLMAKLLECKMGTTFGNKMFEYSYEKVVAIFGSMYITNPNLSYLATCTLSCGKK